VVMQGDGVVGEYVGGYDDWLKVKQLQAAATRKPATPGSRRARQPAAFGYKQNRELNALPKQIENLEASQEALHQKMAGPDYFRTPPADLEADRQSEAVLTREIEAAYARWETLEALRNAERP
jgi:ATP-binding cassette subfamily F protein uup